MASEFAAGQRELIRKPWGWSWPRVRNELVEIVDIEVVDGGFCSVHLHERKENIFVVVSGTLAVDVWNDDGVFFSRHPLESRLGVLTVPPGRKHQFTAYGPVRAIEIYRPVAGQRLDPNDIVRFSEGGVRA